MLCPLVPLPFLCSSSYCCCCLLCRFHRRFLCTAFIMLYFFAPLFNPLPAVAVVACVDRKCLIFKSVLHFVAQLRVSFSLISLFFCVFVFFGNNNRFPSLCLVILAFWCLEFGLLVSISPGCRLFVRYMQMCRQLFALRICFSRRSCYAYVFVF